MKKVISTERVPIKMWLGDMEDGAIDQAKNLANLPFVFKHIAIMPDSHQGYGMPIGAVLATTNVIIPNAVGVDIGCGMCAVQTSLRDISTSDLKKVMKEAMKLIPVGFNWHSEPNHKAMPAVSNYITSPDSIVFQNYDKATYQVGSLGGGNHFVEVQKGSDGHIWIMIHSGSRNLGYSVAKHYNEVAKKLNETYHSVVTPKMELAFLPINTQEAKDYMAEMNYCVEFAKQNRFVMLDRMKDAFNSVIGMSFTSDVINESHNFAAWENHFNKNVIVHRKGATKATLGELGIIPGSQGTKSYIIKGRGNADSFKSCSHGAGRKLGRKAAIRELDFKSELKLMKGIIHNINDVSQLDEAPGAYKDIDVVMENQKELVTIHVELKPLAVIKG